METSKRPKGVSKGMYVDSYAERRGFRCASIESLMEDEDKVDSMLRYSNSVKAARTEQARRSQSRSMGRGSRDKED